MLVICRYRVAGCSGSSAALRTAGPIWAVYRWFARPTEAVIAHRKTVALQAIGCVWGYLDRLYVRRCLGGVWTAAGHGPLRFGGSTQIAIG